MSVVWNILCVRSLLFTILAYTAPSMHGNPYDFMLQHKNCYVISINDKMIAEPVSVSHEGGISHKCHHFILVIWPTPLQKYLLLDDRANIFPFLKYNFAFLGQHIPSRKGLFCGQTLREAHMHIGQNGGGWAGMWWFYD